MSYLDNNLQANETVEYIAEVHWIIFIKPIIFLMLGFILYHANIVMANYTGLLLMILGCILLIISLLLKVGTEYIITNKRVILKSGVLRQDALEIVLNKCEGLRIYQSITGRIFGFGSIIVTTGGATNTFTHVTNPSKFRNEINRLIP